MTVPENPAPPAPEGFVEFEARRRAFEKRPDVERSIRGRLPGFSFGVPDARGFGMELDAEHVPEALVLDGLHDFSVHGGGDRPQAFPQFRQSLVMGTQNAGLVGRLETHERAEFSVRIESDLMIGGSHEPFLGKKLDIRIAVPERGP